MWQAWINVILGLWFIVAAFTIAASKTANITNNLITGIILVILGIWAAIDGDWDFGQAWISIGFAAFLFSFFLGLGFLGPESGRIKALVEARGLDHPEVTRRTKRILLLSRIELVILVIAIWAMVTKPGL